jgi:hypothetical protein
MADASLTIQFQSAVAQMRSQTHTRPYEAAARNLCETFRSLWAGMTDRDEKCKLAGLFAKTIAEEACSLTQRTHIPNINSAAAVTRMMCETFLYTAGKQFISPKLPARLEEVAGGLRYNSELQSSNSASKCLSSAANLLSEKVKRMTP